MTRHPNAPTRIQAALVIVLAPTLAFLIWGLVIGSTLEQLTTKVMR